MSELSWFGALATMLRGPVPQPVDRGRFEEDLRHLLGAYPELGTDGVLVEVGGGSGRATLELADRVRPPWTLFVFEPEKSAASRLQTLLKQQGILSKVRVFNSAVTEDETMVLLHKSKIGGRYYIAPASNEAGGVSVMSVRLDGHLGRSGLTRVGLVVVDVGGQEPAVVDSLSDYPLPVPMFVAFRPGALEASGYEPRIFLAQLKERHSVYWMDKMMSHSTAGEQFEARLRSEGGTGLFCQPKGKVA